MAALCFVNIGEKKMNEEMEQILKNHLAIMNVLYNMYKPTLTKYNFKVDIDNRNMLLCNIEQTADLLVRIHNENTDRTNKEY